MVENASYYKASQGKANMWITNQSHWNMSPNNQIPPKKSSGNKKAPPGKVRQICGT